MTTTTDHPVQEASAVPPAPGGSPRLSDRGLAVAFITPALLLLLGMSVFPLLWALFNSFRDYAYTATNGYASFGGFTLGNYAAAWERGNFLQTFGNSVLITVPAVVLTLLLAR